MAAFVWWELRQQDPMMKVELFKLRNFWAGNVITGVMAFGMFGIFFPITIFLQGDPRLHADPGRVGARPDGLHDHARSAHRRTPERQDRISLAARCRTVDRCNRRLLSVNPPDASKRSIWDLFPALVVTGLGMGMTFPPMTNATMKEVPPRISGSASGILNTTRNLGQILGIAILGSALQSWAGSYTSNELAGVAIDPALKARISELAGEGRTELVPSAIPGRASGPDPGGHGSRLAGLRPCDAEHLQYQYRRAGRCSSDRITHP